MNVLCAFCIQILSHPPATNQSPLPLNNTLSSLHTSECDMFTALFERLKVKVAERYAETVDTEVIWDCVPDTAGRRLMAARLDAVSAAFGDNNRVVAVGATAASRSFMDVDSSAPAMRASGRALAAAVAAGW